MDLCNGPCPLFFRLIDGHNQLDGLMRWTVSVIFRLIDGHNQLDAMDASIIFVMHGRHNQLDGLCSHV